MKSITTPIVRLLGVGLLLLLATLLAVSTISLPHAHARAATPADCAEISYQQVPNSPGTVHVVVPFCQVDSLVRSLRQKSNPDAQCAALGFLGEIVASHFLPGSGASIDPNFSKNTLRCTLNWANFDALANTFQRQSDACKQDKPDSIGIHYQSQDSPGSNGSISRSITGWGCAAKGEGTAGEISSEDGVAGFPPLQIQIAFSDDGSTLAEVSTDDVATDSSNDAQGIASVPDGSAIPNEAG